MPKTPAVPLWDRLLHEIWWMIFSWPQDERNDGRSTLREHYARRCTTEGSNRG